jgi:hypothetical protein
MSAITTCHQTLYHIAQGGTWSLFSKTPALRNVHSMLGKLYNNPRVPEKPPESHQNCERLQPGGLSPEIKVSTLRHLTTCQAVVLRSEKRLRMIYTTSPLHHHLAPFGSRIHILSMGIQPYPQGKSPWYPLGRRLGGPQSIQNIFPSLCLPVTHSEICCVNKLFTSNFCLFNFTPI